MCHNSSLLPPATTAKLPSCTHSTLIGLGETEETGWTTAKNEAVITFYCRFCQAQQVNRMWTIGGQPVMTGQITDVTRKEKHENKRGQERVHFAPMYISFALPPRDITVQPKNHSVDMVHTTFSAQETRTNWKLAKARTNTLRVFPFSI